MGQHLININEYMYVVTSVMNRSETSTSLPSGSEKED